MPEIPIKFTITDITPVCPGMSRPGLDGEVFIALKQVDNLIRDMRVGISIPASVTDGDSAVKIYLLYVSLITDVILSDLALSAIHKIDLAVLMKQRILVEYAAKAEYFHQDPDYALYMMTVGEAESTYNKLELAKSDPSAVASAALHIAEMQKQFPHVAGVKPKKFYQIMSSITTDDDYVWLYGAPSALLHGDPEGFRQLLKTDDKNQQTISLDLDDDYLNALMVDAGTNVCMFCRAFISRFHSTDAEVSKRLDDLERQFKKLILKHSHGRDEEILKQVKADLEGVKA